MSCDCGCNCVAEEAPICGVDEELVDGVCQKVSVTLDFNLDSAIVQLEASTGRQVVRITGTAFTEGINKNSWGLTREGAESVSSQLNGIDLTLLHPEAGPGGFTRNMDGGVEEAVVGEVISASITDSDAWVVKFIADVYRSELFEALESGLWLREGYGVSIGGTGMPETVAEHKDGTVEMWFGADFNLDHLAIVHKPAYEEAKIDSVERIEVAESTETEEATQEFICSKSLPSNYQQVTAMTEDNLDAPEVEDTSAIDELNDLRAELILANATIDEFAAQAAEEAEGERKELVDEATKLGMKGHDDLNTDTLTGLIASWNDAHPPVEEREMKPVEADTSATPAIVEATEEAMVTNFLNGEKVSTPESVYAQVWNVWADQWNGQMNNDDLSAPTYEQAKERRMI